MNALEDLIEVYSMDLDVNALTVLEGVADAKAKK